MQSALNAMHDLHVCDFCESTSSCIELVGLRCGFPFFSENWLRPASSSSGVKLDRKDFLDPDECVGGVIMEHNA